MMLGALAAGLLFLVSYLLQVALRGHGRFPGHDWVRGIFLVVLASHTLLAALVVPLALWTVALAARSRFAAHRRLAPVTFWIWLYVSLTGVLIYWMSHHLRPPV